jgi:protein arginine N-methyltransferase 2
VIFPHSFWVRNHEPALLTRPFPPTKEHSYSSTIYKQLPPHTQTMSQPRPPTPTSIAALLRAASDHNVPALTTLLKTVPAQVQEPITLRTPLHAAVESLPTANPSSPDTDTARVQAAVETVRVLLFHGAIWNDLDARGETAGCVALRKGNGGGVVYEELVMAGVRAEVLIGRMGVDSESEGEVGDVTAEGYLGSGVRYEERKLLDDAGNGVMMEWERAIMVRSAEELLPLTSPPPAGKGWRVLNVGFGMGIVDAAFEERLGSGSGVHYIVEPHPAVLAKMREDGWYGKPGVTVLEGRWQDVLPTLIETGEVTFDAIYFDTFAEDYSALKLFFNEVVIALMESEGGRFGFFHGLGADRRISYDVYTKVLEIDLFEAGLEVEWKEVEIAIAEEEWDGVTRRYWDVGKVYKLPICKFLG